MPLHIGQRVVLRTLFRAGEFPGEVVLRECLKCICDDNNGGVCTVRLDCQKPLVHGVLYYDGPIPDKVPAHHWHVCCPEDQEDED